jgi:uncharacterized protein (TIGR02271 family)
MTLINLSHEDIDSDYDLEGYECLDADGEKLGDVDGVIVEAESMRPRYIIVDAGGWLSTRRFVVPAGDIRAIDDDEHEVHFHALTKATLERGRYPRYDESWWERNDRAGFRAYEQGVARVYGLHGDADATVDYTRPLYRPPHQGAERLQLMEEHLRAGKERYQAGAVRLGKRIVMHTETVNVPVREERVIIERTLVSDASRTGTITGRETVVEVPVMKEQVRLEKQPVVVERVTARKETVERMEQIEATVRKEELVVEGDEELIADAGQPVAPVYEHERAGRHRP